MDTAPSPVTTTRPQSHRKVATAAALASVIALVPIKILAGRAGSRTDG
ncbi:hypothetical protein [Streptomyces phaeolivaceus]|nr:hypothetical protein [Streptomyces phaeolivaceus]